MGKIVAGILLVLLASCQDGKKKYGSYFVKGDMRIVNGDTLLNGNIEYYDSTGTLIVKEVFRDNLRTGVSVRYAGKRVIEESNYSYGYLNGWKTDYDSFGNPLIRSFYYFDRPVGPRINYAQDAPYYFRFTNFDQRILYECKMLNDSVVYENGSLLYSTASSIEEDGIEKIRLYLYVIEPPFKKVNYRIYDMDEILGKGSLVDECTSVNGFFHEFFLDLPRPGHKYIIRTNVYLEKKGVTIFNDADVNLPSERGSF